MTYGIISSPRTPVGGRGAAAASGAGPARGSVDEIATSVTFDRRPPGIAPPARPFHELSVILKRHAERHTESNKRHARVMPTSQNFYCLRWAINALICVAASSAASLTPILPVSAFWIMFGTMLFMI